MPQVSIVTATFNRANVLRWTIESVLAQTFADWELIVVGDACTDDTEDVVRSFGDPRLRFVNLAVNSGEQATPNNEGIRLARGAFVAMLNHDDLWTREHLATCIEGIGDADFVSTLTLYLTADGDVHLSGVCPRGVYEPTAPVVASSWFFRRAMFESAGPWRRGREMHVTPSQEWLFRAWKTKHVMRSIARPTVIAIPSGKRAGSYFDDASKNAEYAALLKNDPHIVERLLTAAAVRLTAGTQDVSIAKPLVRALRNIARRIALATGHHPHALSNAILYRRRGGLLDALRRTRGLPPLPRGETS